MGRLPRPTAIKALEGTTRPDRANPAEPTPPTIELGSEPPTWLSDEVARRYWTDLVDLLGGPAGIAAVTDATALAILAQAFGAWRRWSDWLANPRHGPTYRTKTATGSWMYRPRPEVAYLDAAETRLVSMLREFGMTPSTRARIHALQTGAQADPAEEFLSGRRGA